MLRFSIIIIHRNNQERLHSLIENIRSIKSSDDEIIVIDNNSPDKSGLSLSKNKENSDIQFILNNCNAGYGHSCNQGMRLAKGKFFLLCNNDIKLKKGILEKFEKYFQINKRAGLIGPQMFSPDGKKMRSYGSRNITFFSQLDFIGRPLKNQELHCFSKVAILRGACLAVNKKMIADIGMYDEDFYFYHEETEWCHRINKSKKWSVFFSPEISISHVGGGSTNSVFTDSRIEFIRSRVQFWFKLFPQYQAVLIFLWNIPKLFFDFLFYLIMTLFTLGLEKRYKNKLKDRGIVILWLLLGMPKKWGLPDKCHLR